MNRTILLFTNSRSFIFDCLTHLTSEESFQSYNPARRAMYFIKQGFKGWKDFFDFPEIFCKIFQRFPAAGRPI